MDAEWARWLLGGAGAAFVLVIGFMIARLYTTIDGKANRDSVNDRFERMFNSLDKHIESDAKVHCDISDKMSIQNSTLSEIRGYLAAQSQHDRTNGG